jgi:transcriptional regulator with XRE-family HTH domain
MECTDLLTFIGNRIRTVRKARKVSQEKLAELSGLHPIFISNVENGKVKASICTYYNIAHALDMALSELVEMPAANESWDSNLVVLFQSAKKLDIHKQKAFVDTVKGLLVGLEGL